MLSLLPQALTCDSIFFDSFFFTNNVNCVNCSCNCVAGECTNRYTGPEFARYTYKAAPAILDLKDTAMPQTVRN